ncbi:hypothetical protein QJU23_03670 [Pasteurella atlantica]|uniref:Uncharacterized protein n=2 Tax=Pasteurellaceae TaxID=712 RepID=A0ACC6HKX9_9PAST|nr:hypothetical protein [Pasteurella atlantica]MDP8051525.1 hypothetical protein [Pasteurella atlantica]MDP8104896.1 hypothetical protein [Pasteurella atlantica]MDP8148270.1 hypothetical protein [Pasteurella atlantica]
MNNIMFEELPELSGIFVESTVIDSFNRLVFASLWGHTAAIQNLIALITTGDLTAITVNNTYISVDKEMIKKVGKLPSDNDYGDMTHAFIYRKTTQVENVGRRDVLFQHTPSEKLIFNIIKSMSILPLLDNWQAPLLKIFREKNMLINLTTLCGTVRGVNINLSDENELSTMVGSLLQTRQLNIVEG